MRIPARIVAAAWYALLAASAGLAADTDPFLGIWILDVGHSQYDAGELPQGMRIIMEAQGTGVHYRSETHFPSGRTTTAEYTADYEGHMAPVLGDHGLLLPVIVKRMDARTQLVSYVSGLKVVATSTRSVSADGRHLTITTTSNDSTGRQHVNIGAYVKDP